ncbi:MAG: terminase family protein [Chlorobiaceae bacterium]
MSTPSLSKYFLPYQIAWLLDDSPFKIWEKTRRGGMTYVQSYEDVRDAVAGRWDVWFSSADETAAREYILYCEKWAKLFKMAAEQFNESVFDDTGKPIAVFSIRFTNGKRITALSSSPSQFRSKGGKVVLDEFAWHKDQAGMWAAAEPVTTWGFPLRIISTHNGKGCVFFKLIDKAAEIGGVVHKTSIYDAVEQGLVDKIVQHKTTESERTAWLESKRKKVGPTVWAQEYCCEPIDESTAFLSYNLIESCTENGLLKGLHELLYPFVLGMDIGRYRNLSVIWIAELIERRRYTRIIEPMEKTAFRTQYKTLSTFLSHPLCYRACIDKKGMGEQMAEDAQQDYGSYRVEAVEFTNASKNAMAEGIKTQMEDREFLIPGDGKLADTIREDLHSVQQEVSPAGNMRFNVNENEENPNSHADYFWAAALCNNAAGNDTLGVPQVTTLSEEAKRQRARYSAHIRKLLSGYRRS